MHDHLVSFVVETDVFGESLPRRMFHRLWGRQQNLLCFPLAGIGRSSTHGVCSACARHVFLTLSLTDFKNRERNNAIWAIDTDFFARFRAQQGASHGIVWRNFVLEVIRLPIVDNVKHLGFTAALLEHLDPSPDRNRIGGIALRHDFLPPIVHRCNNTMRTLQPLVPVSAVFTGILLLQQIVCRAGDSREFTVGGMCSVKRSDTLTGSVRHCDVPSRHRNSVA
jgi:hypothetical protein